MATVREDLLQLLEIEHSFPSRRTTSIQPKRKRKVFERNRCSPPKPHSRKALLQFLPWTTSTMPSRITRSTSEVVKSPVVFRRAISSMRQRIKCLTAERSFTSHGCSQPVIKAGTITKCILASATARTTASCRCTLHDSL